MRQDNTCDHVCGDIRHICPTHDRPLRSAQRFPEVRRLTTKDVEALDMLTELAGDPDLRLDMNFMPGDIQFLHNHTILHARSAYEDWPEAQRKRQLLRLWLSPPGARPLPPILAACYGDLTIADRGGII